MPTVFAFVRVRLYRAFLGSLVWRHIGTSGSRISVANGVISLHFLLFSTRVDVIKYHHDSETKETM